MGEIHFNVTLHIPDAIQSIGKTCIDKVAQLKNACTSIKNEIKGNGKIKTLHNTISGRAHQVKQKIHDKIDSVKNFFDGSPDFANINENLTGIDEKLLYSKHFMDAVIQVHNAKISFKTKGAYAQELNQKLQEMVTQRFCSQSEITDLKNFLSEKANNSDPFVAPHSKASEIADKVIDTGNKVIDKGKKILDNISGKIKDAATNIKFFFDKSPTIKDICNKIGIERETFQSYPEDFQKFLLANLKDCCDDSATNKINMLKNIIQDFEAYKSNKKTSVSNEDVNTFLNEIKQEIEELAPEAQKELMLYNKLLLNKELALNSNPTEKDIALGIAKTFGGETLTGKYTLKIGQKDVQVTTTNIPQKKLLGFGQDKDFLQFPSLMRGVNSNSEHLNHATNLFEQKITIGEEGNNTQTISFIRHGSTRGDENASKEILSHALLTQFSIDELEASEGGQALTLNYSNIQLMTPGLGEKLTDNDIPLNQINQFNELAKTEKQPLELSYKASNGEIKTVKVKLAPPLLFNFGTNAQWHCKIFSRITPGKEDIMKLNDKSFINLFGDLDIFGGKNTLVKNQEDGHYSFDETSIIGENLSDKSLDENTREQILNLADQIIDICSKNKQGLSKDPYALPRDVAMLTNRLGYATSYNCKSGKDRTGVMSMELENLAAKIFTDNKPYNQTEKLEEQRSNLQKLYKSGIAVNIAKTNNGIAQEGLKIGSYGIFNGLKERFGFDLAEKFEDNLEVLNGNKK